MLEEIQSMRNNSRIIGKFPRIKTANTVYKVLNSDADEEEDNVLINRVTEMYFKSWKIH